MASPIEMMIDQACGIAPDYKWPQMVTLRCPKCLREKQVEKDKTDLSGTCVVVATCDKCDSDGFDEILYLDKAGKQLFDC